MLPEYLSEGPLTYKQCFTTASTWHKVKHKYYKENGMNDEIEQKPDTEHEAPDSIQPGLAPEGSHDEVSAIQPTEDTPEPAPLTVAPKGTHIHLTPKKKKLIIAFVIVVIGLALGSGYFFGTRHKSSQNTVAPQKSVEKTNVETPKVQAITENTFLDSPKRLEDLKFYKNPDDYFGRECVNGETSNCSKPSVTSADIQYYQVGTTKAGEMIVSYVVPYGVDSENHIAIKRSDTKYDLLTQQDGGISYQLYGAHANADYRKSLTEGLSSIVQLDEKTTLPELAFPDNPTISGQAIKRVTYDTTKWNQYLIANGQPFGLVLKDSKQFGTQGDKTFYRTDKSAGNNFTVTTISGALKKDFATAYKIDDPIINNASDPQKISWKSGEQNQSIYYSNSGGCGTPNGYVFANNVPAAQLVTVGTSADGRALYQLPASSAITQELFNDDYGQGKDLSEPSLKNLTTQQFLDKHGYFLVRNSLGEYTLLLRDDLFIRGGCGKPVVYLYPEKTTIVSVAVGANVKVSTPTYPAGGWKNVLATPGGSLTYQGKQYGSLFWEGYGYGQYPVITNGTIVKRQNAVSTIRTQLSTLGLNQKETSDFLDFWAPKLPNAAYVRLTWFDNRQLDILAPITITPRPQTTIRVFLDFEGLNQPVTLPQQALKHTDRKGFTAVEWGGLLREGIRN